MNNNAVRLIYNSENAALDIIKDSLNCRLHSGGETFNEYLHTGGWVTRPFTTFSHLIKGRSRIAFDMSPETEILRKPGSTTCLQSGVWRKSQGISQEGTNFIWVRVSFTIFGGLDLLSFFEVPQVFPVKYAAEFKSLISSLLDFGNDDSSSLPRRAVKMQKTLYELLWLVLNLSKEKKDSFYSLVAAQRFAAVLEYINMHFNEIIEIEKLAKMAGLSKSRFHRVFKQAFNVSPTEYQLRLKIKEAQKLLLFSDLNMAQIAEKTGYTDQFYFSRTFKSRFGQSPMQYRKNNLVDRYSL